MKKTTTSELVGFLAAVARALTSAHTRIVALEMTINDYPELREIYRVNLEAVNRTPPVLTDLGPISRLEEALLQD